MELVTKFQNTQNESQKKQLLDKIIISIKKYEFPYIIFLLKQNLLQNLQKQSNQTLKKTKIASLKKQIQKIYPNFFQQIIDYNEKKKIINDDTTQNKNYSTPSLINFFKIFIDILESTNIQTTNNKIKSASIMALSLPFSQQQQQKQKKCFEQIATNYIKYRIQQQRLKEKNSINNICCKLIYFPNELINIQQGDYQQFKSYSWPIKNVPIQSQIKKTIIGFMNYKGGVMYLGIKQDEDKQNWITGIQLTDKQIKQIIQKFSQYLQDIHPKHLGFKKQYTNMPNQPISKNLFILNDYVRLQFLPIVNKQTFLNESVENQKNQKKTSYILKIFVKKGHPKHIYHLLKEKTIECYFRNSRVVQKKPFNQIYRLIYQNLQQFDKIKQQLKKKLKQQEFSKLQFNMKKKEKQEIKKNILTKLENQKCQQLKKYVFHNYCQYQMDIKYLILQEDKPYFYQQLDDDSDSDEDEQ